MVVNRDTIKHLVRPLLILQLTFFRRYYQTFKQENQDFRFSTCSTTPKQQLAPGYSNLISFNLQVLKYKIDFFLITILADINTLTGRLDVIEEFMNNEEMLSEVTKILNSFLDLDMMIHKVKIF